jgi:hypothetical protein
VRTKLGGRGWVRAHRRITSVWACLMEALAAALAEVALVLDERARRLLCGAGACRLGRGGIKLIAAAPLARWNDGLLVPRLTNPPT